MADLIAEREERRRAILELMAMEEAERLRVEEDRKRRKYEAGKLKAESMLAVLLVRCPSREFVRLCYTTSRALRPRAKRRWPPFAGGRCIGGWRGE